MKKHFLLILAFLAFICDAPASTTTIHLLDSTVTVKESSVFGNSKTLYQYNNKGTLIRRTSIYASWTKWKVGVPMIMNRKSVIVYDDEGHEIDLYYSSLDTATGKWTDDHRYLYDEWHNRTYSVGKWNADSTALLSGVRYFYDSNHLLIGNESFDTWNGVEVVTDKYFYTNDENGNKISMYGQFRPDSAYEGNYKSDPDKFNQSGWKFVDSAYYERNSAGQSIKETFFRWNESDNQWIKDGYQAFTYDEQGHLLTDTVFARDFETNIITYNNLTVRTYDTYGNMIRSTNYIPIVSDNQTLWQINYSSINEYTYDENNLIISCRSYTDNNDGAQPNYTTTTYYYSHYNLDENGLIVPEPEPCLLASGTCGAQGDNLTWELSCDSVLTISGTGEMQGCYTNQPWRYVDMAITKVIIKEGVTSIGHWAFPGCNNITSISLPNSLIKIEYSALSCSKLRSIIIPENVSEIGQNALKGSGLENIQVAEGNPFFCSVDGVLFNKDTTILLCYPEALQGECVIPSNVNKIGYLALSVSGITKITCNPITPPQLDKGALIDIDKSIPVYVSYESIDLYKTSNGWKDFTNILPKDAYWVEFIDWNGEEIKSGWVKESSAAIPPSDPMREGYTFIGWDKAFDNVTEDLIVTALYEAGESTTCTLLFQNGINESEITQESITFSLPIAPSIQGFTFMKWVVIGGDLTDQIVIQAIYEADIPSSVSELYTNPANPAQKLIRNGNVYILTDDKVYTITGQEVK